MRWLNALILACVAHGAYGGNQKYEPLSDSVRFEMRSAIGDSSDQPPEYLSSFDSIDEARVWLNAMSPKLQRRFPDTRAREEFLLTVHEEAARAALDPQMVLGLIQIESNFQKYSVSSAKARGYMQVMPFWVDLIGRSGHNLFHLRTNLRYGCTILRHYLDRERGDYYRALGRYNGSLGKADYPNTVVRAWVSNWKYPLRAASASR